MANFTGKWSGEMREGERLVGNNTPLEELHSGDLMIIRHSAYGCGDCQMLFVAYIDGYGGDVPVCWTCYVKPELEAQVIDYDRPFDDPTNYKVKFNTWADVRNFGDSVYGSDARNFFPQLDKLLYHG